MAVQVGFWTQGDSSQDCFKQQPSTRMANKTQARLEFLQNEIAYVVALGFLGFRVP